MLARSLAYLSEQAVNAQIQLSFVVVDNAEQPVERGAVAGLAASSKYSFLYVHEPRAGIPVARNAALEAALRLDPDWIAFIDDDEVAPPCWIESLHREAVRHGADVMQGAVVRVRTADEAEKAAFIWRPSDASDRVKRTDTAPTSNVIFRSNLVRPPLSLRFDESMRFGGSDNEFFMRANLAGLKLLATTGSKVFEEFPADRATLRSEAMRAFRVGATINYRYRKNLGPVKGNLAILARLIGKVANAIYDGALAALLCIARPDKSRQFSNRSVKSAATGWGLIAPYFKIQPDRYWTIVVATPFA
jgi:succinoglycan biosynthesis protein ExoM